MNIKGQIILLSFFLLFIVVGCSKKENDKISPPSVLIGNWKDMGIKGSVSINFNNQKVSQIFDTLRKDMFTEFKSDSSVVNFDYIDGNLNFTKYTNTANQLTIFGLNGNKAYDFKFNFQLNGNTLLLSMDKSLFGENIARLKAAGVDSDLTVYGEFIPNITDFKYEHTFTKQ
jgi:hypothetical protein